MNIPFNSYNHYILHFQVLRQLLSDQLTLSNKVRSEAKLPCRDIQAELDLSFPIISEEIFDYVKSYYVGYKKFRKEHLSFKPLHKIDPDDTWQRRRSLSTTNACIESEIRTAWHKLKTGEEERPALGDWIVKL